MFIREMDDQIVEHMNVTDDMLESFCIRYSGTIRRNSNGFRILSLKTFGYIISDINKKRGYLKSIFDKILLPKPESDSKNRDPYTRHDIIDTMIVCDWSGISYALLYKKRMYNHLWHNELVFVSISHYLLSGYGLFALKKIGSRRMSYLRKESHITIAYITGDIMNIPKCSKRARPNTCIQVQIRKNTKRRAIMTATYRCKYGHSLGIGVMANDPSINNRRVDFITGYSSSLIHNARIGTCIQNLSAFDQVPFFRTWDVQEYIKIPIKVFAEIEAGGEIALDYMIPHVRTRGIQFLIDIYTYIHINAHTYIYT